MTGLNKPVIIGDAERLRWLANRVLYCDYGDNERCGIGWGIRREMREGQQFMFGSSINDAIDAAISADAAAVPDNARAK